LKTLKSICLKQQHMDKLIEHKQYIARHGQDMPVMLNWKWSNSGAVYDRGAYSRTAACG
jgi:xylulose-5-phosphate/fructose-6-phosphate phosphoketolase